MPSLLKKIILEKKIFQGSISYMKVKYQGFFKKYWRWLTKHLVYFRWYDLCAERIAHTLLFLKSIGDGRRSTWYTLDKMIFAQKRFCIHFAPSFLPIPSFLELFLFSFTEIWNLLGYCGVLHIYIILAATLAGWGRLPGCPYIAPWATWESTLFLCDSGMLLSSCWLFLICYVNRSYCDK